MKGILSLTAVTLTLAPTLALAGPHAHYDIRPYIEGGKLYAGGYSHDDPAEDSAGPFDKFSYDFGEDPLDPYFVDDPGFSLRKGSAGETFGWLNGSRQGFNILTSLYYWDGSGTPALTAPTTNESITWFVGSNTRTITGSSGAQTGFNLNTANTGVANGADILHRHIGSTLNPGDLLDPAEGVYFFQIELTTDQSGIASSDPIWIIYGNFADEEESHEAHESLEAWLDGDSGGGIPEPASLSVLGLGAAGLLFRRRKVSLR